MNNHSFAIFEIGSTNTKGYIYKNHTLYDSGFRNINFKKNYNTYGHITSDDKSSLLEFISKIRSSVDSVYLYGTSIFRELSIIELTDFTDLLRQKGIDHFKVVSPTEENRYTVLGAIKNLHTQENIAVLVGGGGSTEISICQGSRILEQANTPFGVVNILEKFPSLSQDQNTTSLETVVDYVTSHLCYPSNAAKRLILAGGNFILRYKKAHYPLEQNILFKDADCPYTIDAIKNYIYDQQFFINTNLNNLRKQTPLTPNWWDGTRAMCACVNAVAHKLGAETLIPTKITMVHGIISEINSALK